jgi:hypothetical protein
VGGEIADIPLTAAKKGESMADRGWRGELSSSSLPGPASGPLAPAAAAGRQERDDESLLPASLSISWCCSGDLG